MGAPVHNPPRLTRADIVQTRDDTPPDIVAALDAYFEPFAAPVTVDGEYVCLSCGKPIDSFKQALGLGVAWCWALVHGECNCSGCGWPGRGMHYIKDAQGEEFVTLRNLFLAYHPDVVTRRKAG